MSRTPYLAPLCPAAQTWLHRAETWREATPHALRHAFATKLYAATSDVLLVKDALGHSTIAATLMRRSARHTYGMLLEQSRIPRLIGKGKS